MKRFDDLKFFLDLGQPDRWRLRLGAGLAALTLLTGIGLLSLSGWFITAAAAAGLAAAAGAFNYLFPSGGVRGFALGRTASRYAERMVTHDATFRTLARLRLWVFERAAPLSPGRLSGLRAGDVLSRVTQDVDSLDNLYLRVLTPITAAIAGGLLATGLLAWFAPAALPGVIGAFVLASVVLPLMAAKAGKGPGEALTAHAAEARAEAGDLVSGLAELKAYGADTRIIDRLDEASQNWISNQRKLADGSLFNGAILAFAGPASFVIGVTSAALSGAPAPLAALAGFVGFALFEASAPLVQAAELFGKTNSSAKRLRELDTMEPLVTDPASPAPLPADASVEITELSFAYPGADHDALSDVSLNLPEGARLAVVGASGSGKSSLIRLLMRFYAPQSGLITLGGSDVSRHRIEDVRSRFALVDQRAELLSTTVRANLRLARPDASDEDLWKALELARAADFVRNMPDGLKTWIGEDGALVSGGQGRRLALARAFLKDAPILLLDEPTEGLDEATETEFLDALDAWLDENPRRSVLMVTHRASLLHRAKTGLVLEDGNVVDTGTITALAGKGGAFDRLFPEFES
ncbi:thiol reductant ABC exporter subunit CydC [Maricaulaceae bacterium EIL42A08]|nr:thiol reductant ABC exporter subunit CydC [Maricaulaceae bacterium EIL42A08]